MPNRHWQLGLIYAGKLVATCVLSNWSSASTHQSSETIFAVLCVIDKTSGMLQRFIGDGEESWMRRRGRM